MDKKSNSNHSFACNLIGWVCMQLTHFRLRKQKLILRGRKNKSILKRWKTSNITNAQNVRSLAESMRKNKKQNVKYQYRRCINWAQQSEKEQSKQNPERRMNDHLKWENIFGCCYSGLALISTSRSVVVTAQLHDTLCTQFHLIYAVLSAVLI